MLVAALLCVTASLQPKLKSGGVTEGALSRADAGRHREDSDAVVTVKDI